MKNKIKKSEFKYAITIPELKCSYFLVENKKNSDRDPCLLIRLEEGRMKGIVVEVSKFNFPNDSNTLTFNYNLIYNPYDSVPNVKTLGIFVKKAVLHIVETALKAATDLLNEGDDEDRNADTKVAPVKRELL